MGSLTASIISVDIRWCIFLTNLHLIKLVQAFEALWSLGPRLGQLPGSKFSLAVRRSTQIFYLSKSSITTIHMRMYILMSKGIQHS